MKKIWSLITILLISSTIFSGCNNTPPEIESPETEYIENNWNEIIKNKEEQTKIKKKSWNNDDSKLINKNPYIKREKNKGLITIYSRDYTYWITIQDKNLWAENLWETWLYYQWWNNNWTKENSKVSDKLLKRDEKYDNNGYDGDRNDFIRLHPDMDWNKYYDIWDKNENWEFVYYDNLRWGWLDNEISSEKSKGYNHKKHISENILGRKWPCEEWFHIPSAWEMNELLYLYFSSYDIDDELEIWDGWNHLYTRAYEYNNTWYNEQFTKDLMLPKSYIKGYDSGKVKYNWKDDDYYTYNYWTSSPTPFINNEMFDWSSFAFFIGKWWIYHLSFPRAEWLQIRCFKNEREKY